MTFLDITTIFVKALSYGGALAASGTVLFWLLVAAPGRKPGQMRPMVLWPALVGVIGTLALVPLQASFLGGGTWAAAANPELIGLVADTPLGTSVQLRVVGLALIFLALAPVQWAKYVAAFGTMLVAQSFSLVGHTLSEPRAFLSVLISIHILCIAFWIGSLGPLHRIVDQVSARQAGEVAERFGRIAVWAVAVLVVSGGILLILLTGGETSVITSPYGYIFIVKFAWFFALMALAAQNKLMLTPDLKADKDGAQNALMRSIRWEIGCVVVILLATATLTTIASPKMTG
jgi:putative copper resistance protein D